MHLEDCLYRPKLWDQERTTRFLQLLAEKLVGVDTAVVVALVDVRERAVA